MINLGGVTAFISGGAGFIGIHLVEHLLARSPSNHLIVYDNFTSGNDGHLAILNSDQKVRVVKGDIKDLETLTEAMAGCDVVFHLAANPDIAKAVTNPGIDFWDGTYLTHNILEAMRLNGIKQIIYTSGSGVYGEDPQMYFTETYGPCLPISSYGASKLASEALIGAYCHMFSMSGLVFRFANVVGPRQTHGVGYDFVRRLKENPTRLRILGDGTQSKSYVHVEDVLEAMSVSATHCDKQFDVFNVATDDYITVKEIAEIAVTETGCDPSRVSYDFTGGDRGWKGDVPVVRFNAEKIKSFGWQAKRTSKEAMRDAIRAMRKEIG